MTRRNPGFDLPDPLAGRGIIVAGGGTGAGAAICHELAVNGARVVVLDPSCAAAQATARRILAIGGDALPLVADIADEAQARSAVAAAHDWLGGIDTVVICSRPGMSGALHDVPLAAWEQDMERGLRGAFLLARLVLPHLRHRGFGSIVCVASPLDSIAAGASWQAVRWSQLGLCDSLRATVAPDRIRVLAVIVGARDDGSAAHVPPGLPVSHAEDPLEAAAIVADALAGPRVPASRVAMERPSAAR